MGPELMRAEGGAKAWPSADAEEHALEIHNAHDWRRPAIGQRGSADRALAIAVTEQDGGRRSEREGRNHRPRENKG